MVPLAMVKAPPPTEPTMAPDAIAPELMAPDAILNVLIEPEA